MKVKIIVSRAAYPIVGAVIDIPEVICKQLVTSGLAVYVDDKPKKKTSKKNKDEMKPENETEG